jgi:hypothetical protein
MSQRVKKYLPLLQLLAESSPTSRKQILKSADDGMIKLLVECCHNTLKGGIKLSSLKIKKLKKYKKAIRVIAKPGKNLKKKKKDLIQTGSGFLSILLPSVISGLVAFLNRNKQ